MKYKILITGASGQIGTNLILKLHNNISCEILGIDKRPNTWTNEIKIEIIDIAKQNLTHLPPVDLVIHFAANAKVHQLTLQPQYARDNFLMTFNVLEYCRKYNTPLIFSSTREVYGDIKRYDNTNEKEADFSTTESPYSASKISSEAFVYSYSRCYNLPYLVFRFSNVYGRYDNDLLRMERVIPLFFNKISNDEPITIYGREKTLDFTYIDDCTNGIVSGIKKLLQKKLKNKTFNLAFGQGNKLSTVVEEFEKILNKKATLNYESSRLGEVVHYVANLSQARKYLDYQPKTPLKDGLQKTALWYSKNPT